MTPALRCAKKHGHLSAGAAAAHIRAMERVGMDTTRVRAYWCPMCGLWHVGHRKMQQMERGEG